MAENVKRATIYLDPLLHKALKIKAAETSETISELVNSAIRESLREDIEDLETIDKRSDEPLIGYEEFVKKLKKDDRL